MSQLSRTEWEALYGTTGTVFPDNTTGEISEGDMRTFGKNASDSIPFTRNDSYTWASPQVSTSGTNTYAATPSPAITAYSTGQAFKIKFTEASSGASTLNLNGLGAKKLYVNPTTQATTGDIVDEQVYLLIYDAALDTAAGGFLMIGGSGGGGATAAEDVTFTPAGNLSATDVQAAIEELDSEKYTAASATESAQGLAELATQAETNTGTDDARIVTPLKLASSTKWNSKLDKLVTTRTVTATHELDATDLASINAGAQLEILLNSASPLTLEIPTNAVQAFPTGTVIGGMQYGAGPVTIAPDGGVTMRSPNNANKSFAQYSKFYLEKIGTNEWVLSGDITV